MRNDYHEFASRDPDLVLMRRLWEDGFNKDTLLHGIDFCGDWKEVDLLISYSENLKI